MRIPVIAATFVALLSGSSVASAATSASPAPQATQLPEIYHSISRPLCSALATKILPAIGMLMQDDKTIAKGPPLFQDYIRMAGAGSHEGEDMAVYHLNNLVSPLVQNTLAIQKMLEDPTVFPATPHNDDDKQLIALKDDMLKTLATHQASLDIINGFVQTQQLGEIQHEGEGQLQQMTGQPSDPTQTTNQGQNSLSMTQPPTNEVIGARQGSLAQNTNSPQVFDDLVLNAGLAPNQYEIDPTQIPGLQVGYNQIGNLKSGLEWTQNDSQNAEKALAKTAINAAHTCGAPQAPTAPSPNP
jgi:hypothetical protein